MNKVDRGKVPDIFKRHIGTWKGEYIKTDSTEHFRRRFWGTFTISIAGSAYQQINYYEYADGNRVSLKFEGEFVGGILKMSSISYSDFRAIAWDAGYDTIGFRATKTQDGALITFVETVDLLAQDYRVRSTQAFKDGMFDGISFIEEIRLKPSVTAELLMF